MLARSIEILKNLQYSNGLFSASKMTVKTGYNVAWIRDNVYESMGLMAIQSHKRLKKVYWALLDVLLKHEYKIDWAIKEKPKYHYQYIHPRYDPFTMDEIWEEWGNKQNDAIGALLFLIGSLEESGINVVRDSNDIRILQKLVHYLDSIEYWHDEDNGIWEEGEEVHASSVGACVAGLKKIRKIVEVPNELIEKGKATLTKLLPRESISKETDLALLSLIYPFNVVDDSIKMTILRNVEQRLVRERGVIRYAGDKYYSDGKGIGSEAQWTKGFPWLAIIYKQMNKPDKYAYYMRKTISVMNDRGELPELYYANSSRHNENSPLGWSQALSIVMMMM